MRSRHAIPLSVTAACAALVLTGCGGGAADVASTSTTSPSPTASRIKPSDGPALAKSAATSFDAVSSFRIKGEMADHGKKIRFNLLMGRSGRSVGRMAVKGKGSFKIVTTDLDTAYLKPDDDFWKATGGRAAVTVMHGKWLMATGHKAHGYTKKLNFKAFTTKMFPVDAPGMGKVRAGTPTHVDGQDVIPLTGVPDSDGATATLWIQASGKHYPIRLKGTDAKRTGTMRFSDYNTPVKATAPPKSTIVDLAKMGKR